MKIILLALSRVVFNASAISLFIAIMVSINEMIFELLKDHAKAMVLVRLAVNSLIVCLTARVAIAELEEME